MSYTLYIILYTLRATYHYVSLEARLITPARVGRPRGVDAHVASTSILCIVYRKNTMDRAGRDEDLWVVRRRFRVRGRRFYYYYYYFPADDGNDAVASHACVVVLERRTLGSTHLHVIKSGRGLGEESQWGATDTRALFVKLKLRFNDLLQSPLTMVFQNLFSVVSGNLLLIKIRFHTNIYAYYFYLKRLLPSRVRRALWAQEKFGVKYIDFHLSMYTVMARFNFKTYWYRVIKTVHNVTHNRVSNFELPSLAFVQELSTWIMIFVGYKIFEFANTRVFERQNG